ncbi:MAG TPA: peptide-methionine (S)-S-oxide reductase MsrA [Planctomycetota bacterium]|jgi:peptide-methionine (S)-S-oxide reductase|nr:peptide-methionine (S)-S-oxide reductase MsrA [Planctomycetota bacterium]|tara:strand:+ start:3779 stop:4213 length:435 start_codon:yes stop_codon:yes gene_type:complete
MESLFRQVGGVLDTAVGYCGGTSENPTYEEVCSDGTGHAEVIQVHFDPARVSYERLLQVFFQNHDPTTPNRQGPNIGSQYRSVIFFHGPEQEEAVNVAIQNLVAASTYENSVATQVFPRATFWRAEEYHQRYYEKKGIVPACKL